MPVSRVAPQSTDWDPERENVAADEVRAKPRTVTSDATELVRANGVGSKALVSRTTSLPRSSTHGEMRVSPSLLK